MTEFTPRHAADDLPDGWTDDAEVQMKVTDKHHVWVKRAGGMELQLLIVKRMPATEPVGGSLNPHRSRTESDAIVPASRCICLR